MYERNLTRTLLDALAHRPVVVLHGPRQAGKSWLAQEVASGPHPAEYLTLDDPAVLTATATDPAGFIQALRGNTVIDEVQRAPQLFVAIKASVDRNRHPGRFLLTGSANIWLIPHLSESLAGRMDILTLWPLSQGELERTREHFIDMAFSDDPLPLKRIPVDRADVVKRLFAGGYPEAHSLPPARRARWFASYVTAILQRDVRELAQRIEGLTDLPRLLTALAGRTATLLNAAELSRASGIPERSVLRYLTLLEATFLISRVPAWTGNVRKRLLKTPKVVMVDTGLAAYLQNVDERRLRAEPALIGPLLETLVITELRKEQTWSAIQPEIAHFRTAHGEEVDAVLDARGRLVGIEVKAAASVSPEDFRGLRAMAVATGRRFHRGVLFYLGETAVAVSPQFYALPLPALWRMAG
ncbi:MAG: ATPase [Armatimonadetes bacterium 13_1_40CM_64_14]|nr:MAG: ATPase [Armatimonadetes bacterium 13_1_40CM_64_14]